MDAFLIVTIFGILGIVISGCVFFSWVRNYDYDSSVVPGVLAGISAFVLIVLGIYGNLPFGAVVSSETNDKETLELSPLSAMDYSNWDLRNGEDGKDVYVYLDELGGYDDDYYCFVVPKSSGSIELKLAKVPRKSTSIEELANGEKPSVTVKEKTGVHSTLLGHEVNAFTEYEYVIHVSPDNVSQGSMHELHVHAKTLK